MHFIINVLHVDPAQASTVNILEFEEHSHITYTVEGSFLIFVHSDGVSIFDIIVFDFISIMVYFPICSSYPRINMFETARENLGSTSVYIRKSAIIISPIVTIAYVIAG